MYEVTNILKYMCNTTRLQTQWERSAVRKWFPPSTGDSKNVRLQRREMGRAYCLNRKAGDRILGKIWLSRVRLHPGTEKLKKFLNIDPFGDAKPRL